MLRPALVALAALLLLAPVAEGAAAKRQKSPKFEVLSNRPDLISGGDALVALYLPKGARPGQVRFKLGRTGQRDVTDAFEVRGNGRLEGVVTDLQNGPNLLTARIGNKPGAQITIVNHPNGGPVFSGPQIQPWKCQQGAVDKQCNQSSRFTWFYMPEDEDELQPYDPDNPPSDVATTTTDEGVEVPFIVRVETGYQDRDQFKVATLYRPGEQWSPFAPQKQWNRKLLMTHGGGCGASYGAGGSPNLFDDGTLPGADTVSDDQKVSYSGTVALGRGFAVMSTALNNNGHNCNIVVQAESMLMAKERLIERYGEVRYTIGRGCSGGALAQQQVANAYPGGVYDGLTVTCAYPDTLTPGAQFADYHLLRLYFEDTSRWGAGVVWTPSQWAAVEGHVSHVNAVAADEGLFKSAVDPSNKCGGVSDEQLYNPDTNPGGVRCSILDYMINVLGPRPEADWTPVERQVGRGFGGAPFGNVGIQYGLGPLESGQITMAQFIDLNAKIGGLDIDAKYSPERLAGDDSALVNAYRSGAINEGNNLDTVPIIDHAGPDPGVAHDFSHTWWMRDRLLRVNGDYDNHVLWFGQTPLIGDRAWGPESVLAMDRWLAAIEADQSQTPLATKIIDNKPADVQDRCESAPGVELVGAVCNEPQLQTRYGTPRTVAGGDPASDVNKCQLKPIRREDYRVAVSDAQLAQLQAIFPAGVCDWSKRGVGQQGAVPWITYSNPDGSHAYGGRPIGPQPNSRSCNGRGTIPITLPPALRARRRQARLLLGGRTVARFGPDGVARVRIRGRRARTLRFKVVGRTRSGERRRQTRTALVCAGRRG